MRRLFLVLLAIGLTACDKPLPQEGGITMLIANIVIKNDSSSAIALKAYTYDFLFCNKEIKTLVLNKGEEYRYYQDILNGTLYDKAVINFRASDSLDIVFSEGKSVRLRKMMFEKDENFILNYYWQQTPNPAKAGDDITVSFTVDERLETLAK